MSDKRVYTFASSDIPELAGAIDGTRRADIATELELSARDFSGMTLQNVDGLPAAGVPEDCVLIERASEDLVAVSIEIQGYDFAFVAFQRGVFLSGFEVP